MIKKYVSILISFLLIAFSFFYTNKIIEVFKDNDPIMIEIKKYDEIYKDTKIDSIIIDDSIIPGVKGQKIDIDKSYSNMKKIKSFDKNLLVFKETIPNENIINNYSKYIVSLNKSQNNISLLFELNDNYYVNDILNILSSNNVNATFFISKDFFNNNMDQVKKILLKGNEIELLSSTYSVYEINKYNSMLKLISNEKLNFCVNIDKSKELLKSCETSKLYSIVPNIRITNNLYYNIKNNLKNGIIFLINNNKVVINELQSSINYIKQKGKKIILLKNIIE